MKKITLQSISLEAEKYTLEEACRFGAFELMDLIREFNEEKELSPLILKNLALTYKLLSESCQKLLSDETPCNS